MSTTEKRPTFSIVIAVHDQFGELQEHLPVLLTQQYEDYEVIVVDEQSTDGTDDLLNQQKEVYQHLYTTFLPSYQFQKNRRRLAFTIGVKAAKKEWMILTDITTPPPSEQWLEELQPFASEPSVLLLGYINKKNGNVSINAFEDISQASQLISKAEKWRYEEHNRWLRRLQQNANYDFMVVRRDQAHELLRLFAIEHWLRVPKER